MLEFLTLERQMQKKPVWGALINQENSSQWCPHSFKLFSQEDLIKLLVSKLSGKDYYFVQWDWTSVEDFLGWQLSSSV